MADITKCPGTGCPMRNDCHRFTAPTTEWRQSWFQVVPFRYEILPVFGTGVKVVSCDELWDNKNKS